MTDQGGREDILSYYGNVHILMKVYLAPLILLVFFDGKMVVVIAPAFMSKKRSRTGKCRTVTKLTCV